MVTALWGMTFPLVKWSLDSTEPFTFLVLRCGLGLLLVLPVLGWRRPARSSLAAGALLGVLQAIGFYTQTLGLVHTTATRSAFITGLSVVLVPLLYPIMTRRPPGRLPVLGALFAAIGLYIFTDPGGGGLNRGDWITLGCALSYALFVIALEVTTRKHPYQDMLVMQSWVLAVIFVPGAVVEGFPVRVDLPLVVGVVATAIILALTLYLLSRFQRDTTATRASVIYAAEPVFAAAFAWVLLAERLGPGQAVGAAIIIAGILVAVRRPGESDAPV